MLKRVAAIILTLMMITSLNVVFAGPSKPGGEKPTIHAGPVHNPIKIAIMSDIHVYNPALGTTGSAFQAYLAQDGGRMEVASEAIFDSALDIVLNSDAQVLLIAGDTTNNGELASHELVAEKLDRLTKAGKKVFVINGNHDIFNPGASSYSGNTATRARNASPEDFKALYHALGYDQAIAKDPNSLSYAVNLAPDVQLIAIDSCIYAASNTKPVTGGDISGLKLQWIESQIKSAKAEGKTVIGMMHHGIVPHFTTEPVDFPGFVVNNYAALQNTFSNLGLQIMFTGHFHAQDLAGQYFGNNQYMLDIETGSLVNYPAPIRFVEVTADRKQLNITSTNVTHINYDLNGAADFQTYAMNITSAGLKSLLPQLTISALMSQGESPEAASAAAAKLAATQVAQGVTISDLFVKAVLAHYHGDENLAPATMALLRELASSSDPLVKMTGQNMLSLATDISPADININIDIKTGKVKNGF